MIVCLMMVKQEASVPLLAPHWMAKRESAFLKKAVTKRQTLRTQQHPDNGGKFPLGEL